MKYQKPKMDVLILEMQDVVTLSNGGQTDGNGTVTGAPDEF